MKQNTKPAKKNISKKKQSEQIIEDINVPPHSLESEQAVLGGILLNNEHWESISDQVIADDFYHYTHRLIFQEIEELFRHNSPADLITVGQALSNKGIIQEIGGYAYLAELSKNTPSTANISAYAKIIREKAILRELISVGNKIAQTSYSPKGQDIKTILDEAERDVFQIAEKRTSSNEGPENILAILENTLEKIESLSKSKLNGGITGVTTGFKDLDAKTAGLQPSDLIIVAARPSMGKTTFAMNLCENAAMASEKPVLVFSLEMPSEQIMMRMLASLARVDQTKVRTGQIHDDEEWSRIAGVLSIFKNKPNIYIDDSSNLTPTEVRSRARRVYRENGGLSMIMIDYLQLMRAPGFSDNRTLEIAEISRSLKALAKELEVPVVALSQLNRSLEQRADKRPVNSDLRESGSIEQDADLIMFIYRDEVYHENSEDKGIAEIIIGKQRNGPIGRVRLTFQGKYSRFDNYAGPAYNDDY